MRLGSVGEGRNGELSNKEELLAVSLGITFFSACFYVPSQFVMINGTVEGDAAAAKLSIA